MAIADTDDLFSFVLDRLPPHGEVADVLTSIVYEQRRTKVIEPIRVARKEEFIVRYTSGERVEHG